MKASVSSEIRAQVCGRSCQEEGEGRKATGGIGTAGRAAASGVEGAKAVSCRKSSLQCASIAPYVSLFRTASVYSNNSRDQAPGTSPGNVRKRSSPSPAPKSSVLESETRSRSLVIRFGDGRQSVTPQTSSRTRAPVRVSQLQSIYWHNSR